VRSTITAWSCLLLAACGSDPGGTDSTTDDPASTSSDGSTSVEPESSGSSSSALDDSDSGTGSSSGESDSTSDTGSGTGSSSTGPDGTSSDDGSSSDDGDTSGAVVAECNAGEVNIEAAVGDRTFSGTYQPSGLGMGGPGLVVSFGDDGRIYQRVSLLETGIYPTEPVSGPGYVRLPSEGPNPGAWYCSGEDSSYVTANESTAQLDLVEVGALGSCPGRPVSGTVEVCLGAASCGGQFAVTADLEAGTVEHGLFGLLVGAAIDGSELTGEAFAGEYDGGVVYFRSGQLDETPGTHEADLTDAFFIVPGGQPDAGAVYCAGAGSTMQYMGGFFDPVHVQLQGLSRLGTCPLDDDGEMSVCFQW
jgi:hypothetical protein